MFSAYTDLIKTIQDEVKAEVKAEIKAEAEEKQNESIREYFRQGEKDVGLIAKVLDTSIEHVQEIQREMEKDLAKE